MTIGEILKRRRKEIGISVDKLAEAINKDRATIYRYENGSIENIPLETLEPLAKALSTTPASLMGWDTSPNWLTECPDDENPYELELRDAFSKYDINSQRIIAKNLSKLAQTQSSITDKEKPAIEDELSEDVIIYHRDGKTVKKQFTKEQMDLLLTMINAIPEKPKDI